MGYIHIVFMGIFSKKMVELEVKKKKFNLKILLYTLIVLNIINIIDAVTTYIGVGFRGFIEQNNLYASLFQNIGMLPSTVLKLATIPLFSIIMYKITKYYCEDSLEKFNESIRIGTIYTIPAMIITLNFSRAIVNNIMLLV